MPIIEYECKECGRFERLQKTSQTELSTCPFCSEKGKENPVEKVISASAFHLKGNGWYKTDYANPAKNSTNGKGEASKAKETSSTASSEKGASSTCCGGKCKT